jgi:DNA helicase-2/ATP-dependent DNA helicase PcrA
MVVGDDDQCQPPETMIKVKSKYWGEYEWVSISSLKVGNRVCVYNRPSQKATGTRAVTEISSRYFNGNLHSIQVGGNTTKATPNHKFLVRWTDRSDTNIWAVYLMFRSDMGYRIGCCQVYNSEGAFHLGMRGRLEKADGIWILETHFDKQKARTREVILSINFGLPQVTFEGDGSILSKEAISEIYSTIDTYSAGKKCLEEYGMFENLPLWPLPLTKNSNQGGKQRGTIFRCYAANIIPGIMSIPNEHGDWCDVESNESAPYSGMVYSLNVAEFHNYIADGMVTCNSIYQWRGAHPEFMMGFSREATLITLDINYRSTPSIIKAANSVIAFNQNRILKSAKPNGVSDILPEFCPVTNPDEEATMVLEKMNLQREEKKEWKDFTILYRTNAQSRAFEEVFIQKGVPYQIIGGWDFWKRKEIHDVMSYLKLSVRDDDEAALRVMNKPHRFLGAKTMEKVKTEAKSKNMGVMDIIRSMANGNYQDIRSQQILALKEFLCCVDQVRNLAKQNAEPHQILGYVIDQMGYLEWLLKDEGSDNPENSRTSNLRELQRTSMRFKTANEMIQYLDDLAKEKRKKKVDRNLVTLMSIHRSKGLEFPVVFLVGASEEILPHARNENLEEERRLFYVAITRAREKLYVSSPREIIAGGKIKELNVSRFVFEAGLAVGVP